MSKILLYILILGIVLFLATVLFTAIHWLATPLRVARLTFFERLLNNYWGFLAYWLK